SFEIASFYYVLSLAFFDSASVGVTFWLKKDLFFVASYGCLVAVGAYWSCRNRNIWTRLGQGLAAFAIVSPALWLAAWAISNSLRDQTSNYPDNAWAYAAVFVTVTAAVPAWMASALSGWYLTRSSAPETSRPFQFGISSLLVATLWVGFTLAPVT